MDLFLFLLMVGYVVIILYFINGWQCTKKFIFPNNISPTTRISVIVVARNEEVVIEDCVKNILEQSYPENLLEVIVMDDHSEDSTVAVLKSIKDKRLQVYQLSDSDLNNVIAFKKEAIEIAVSLANGKLIVMTDADCIVPPSWLEEIEAFYQQSKAKMIVGPVMIEPEKGILSKFQSLDMLVMTGLAGAALHYNFPFLANGANLAFEKKAFKKIDGFSNMKELPTGDDVHLLQKFKLHFPERIKYLKSSFALVKTYPLKGVRQLIQQRVRWGSKTKLNHNWRMLIIALITLLANGAIVLYPIIASLIGKWNLHLFFTFCILKLTMDFVFVRLISADLKQSNLLWLFLPLQIIHVLYIFIIGIWSNVGSYTWKGREWTSIKIVE